MVFGSTSLGTVALCGALVLASTPSADGVSTGAGTAAAVGAAVVQSGGAATGAGSATAIGAVISAAVGAAIGLSQCSASGYALVSTFPELNVTRTQRLIARRIVRQVPDE